MATQFQEGYLDELPDYKEPSKSKNTAPKFKEGYLDELEGNVPAPSGTEAAPVKGVLTASTNPYGKMGADEEAVFSTDPLRIQPIRLPKEVEGEFYNFIAGQKGNAGFSQADIDKFWQDKGYQSQVAPDEYIEAVRKGGETGKIDYSSWDQAQIEAENERMSRAIEDFAKNEALTGDYASAVDEGARYGFWGVTARKLNDWFDTNYDELKEQYPNASDEDLERLSDQDFIRRERAARQYYEQANKDSGWVPWLAGQATAAIDPTMFLAPGSSPAGRIAGQAAVGAGTEFVTEAVDAIDNVSDGISPANIAFAGALGGGLQGLFEIGGKIYRRVRGSNGEEVVEEVVNPTPEQAQAAVPQRAMEGEAGLPGPMAMEGEAGIPGPRFTPKAEPEAPVAPPKITVDEVVNRVNDLAADWKNAPEIEVVQSAKELGDDVDPDALGFIGDDGKVRIIADNLQSEADIPAVLYHEALGHHGLNQQFGEGLDDLLNRMYKSEGLKKTVDDWLEANPQYKDLYAEDANPQARIVEEYLVSLGESGQLPPPNLLAAIKHYLKELGRKMKIKGLDYTDSEVMTIIAMAHNATINGKPNAASNGFRYSMEGQKFTKDTVIDDRFKREDTLLRREVKRKNTEKSYEDWQRDWEFDNFIDELEAQRPIGTTEQFEDLSGRGREGPVVQTYTNEELMQRLANGGPRYMKRKGESEGSQTNFGRRETTVEERPYVPVGKIRSNRPGVISILEEAAPVKDRQTQAEWIAASNEVRKSAKQHQKALNPGSEPAEVLAARDSSLKLANRLTDLSVKIRDGMATDNEKWQLEVGMAQLADLLEAIDGVVSNAGRVLRSMGIEVANDAAQIAKIRALLRNKSNLSADEIAEKMADVNFDPNATAQIAKDNFKPSKLDYMTSIRYSAMLSGLTTPSKAIVGTMSNMLLRNASYGGSMFTGKVKPGEWQAYNLGMIRSIVEASRAFKESYGLGVASNSAINRLELQEGVNLPFSKVTEYPRRTLAGIDAFFREIIRGGEVNALAYRQALNEGFTPNTPEFEARADYLIGLPMDEVALQLKNARTAGKKDKALLERLEEEYKLLRDIDKLATKQANLQQLLDNDSMVLKGLEAAGRHGPVSRFIVQNSLPFARNIDNIARMAGRNSWLGLMSPYVRGELKASPERRALMISQMNIGSLLIGLAGYMGYNELAVPSNADDRDMAAVDQAMGKTPGSIKIGDEWISLAGLDAIAVPFITAATTAKAYKDGRSDEMSYAMATLSALNTMIKAFADETVIGQLEQFTGLFERGSNYSEFLASFPSSFMPAAVRQYTQWGEDRAVLDTRGDKSMTDRAIGRVLAGTPEAARKWLIDTFGLSKLPQRLDIFGRPIYREGDAVAAVTGVGRGQKEDSDPAIKEVERLSDIAGKAAVTKTPDDFTVDGEKVKLTPEQRMKWQYDAGQYILSDIKEAMADPVWKTLSDAEKFEEIQIITKEAKDDAKWDNFRDILETDPENQIQEEEEDPAVYEGYIEE